VREPGAVESDCGSFVDPEKTVRFVTFNGRGERI